MEPDIKYRGKTYSHKDISFIRQLIADNPDASRWALSRKLCIAWGWTQKNGALCDQICRSFMLKLDRVGHIGLPPRKRTPFNYLANRRKPPKIEIDQAPLEATLSAIKPLQIFDVRREKNENLCNSLIEQYHYLGVLPAGGGAREIYGLRRPKTDRLYDMVISAPSHWMPG